MTVKVEMTAEEFTEFLQFRKSKAVQNEELSSALRRVRIEMNNLSETLLNAVHCQGFVDDNLKVENKETFKKALELANNWFS